MSAIYEIVDSLSFIKLAQPVIAYILFRIIEKTVNRFWEKIKPKTLRLILTLLKKVEVRIESLF